MIQQRQLTELAICQVLKLHCEEGWFNRRTHQLTKFQLRRQARPTCCLLPPCVVCAPSRKSHKVKEEEIWTTFVYRGKWKWEYA